MRRSPGNTILLAAAFWLAACGDGERPEEGPADRATERSEVPPEPSDDLAAAGRPWTAGIVAVTRPESGVATVIDLRAARHPEFDRIVWEFAGGTRPGYHVEYVDRPVRACGSGQVVPLVGDGWLEVRIEPARAHDDRGSPTLTGRRFQPRLPTVREIAMTCDYEAVVATVIGVSSPNPYRVAELESPPRLVIDIRH